MAGYRYGELVGADRLDQRSVPSRASTGRLRRRCDDRGRRQRTFSAVKLSADSRWPAASSSCSAVGSERPRWDMQVYDTSAPQPKHVVSYHNVSAMDDPPYGSWLIAGHIDGV